MHRSGDTAQPSPLASPPQSPLQHPAAPTSTASSPCKTLDPAKAAAALSRALANATNATTNVQQQQQHPPHHTAPSHLTALASAANAARDALAAEINALRTALLAEHAERTARHRAAALAVDRAATTLAVRALELDNRALHVAHREAAATAAHRRLDRLCATGAADLERDRAALIARDRTVADREASLRYSAVEQHRLHAWARRLDAREARVVDSETAGKQRVAQRVAAVVKREQAVAERERHVEKVMCDREAELCKQQAVVETMQDRLLRERSELLLEFEAERTAFWAHQQKLSTRVAAETEALLAQQARLRSEYERDAATARESLSEMSDALAQLKAQLETVRSEKDANGLVNSIGGLELISPEDREPPRLSKTCSNPKPG